MLLAPSKENEKAGLKMKIQKSKIMASSPITSWQIEGENLEAVTNFLFSGSQITATMKLKDIERKAITNLDSILNRRDFYFANKGTNCQGYGFSSGHVWI